MCDNNFKLNSLMIHYYSFSIIIFGLFDNKDEHNENIA